MPSFERGVYEPPSDEIRVFDDDQDADEEGSRLPLLIVIALLVLFAFSGVVWLAYSQGVQRGRADAPRMIVAAQGPVKEAAPSAGDNHALKIYQQPAPAEEDADADSVPPPPSANTAPMTARPAPAAVPASPPAPVAANPPPSAMTTAPKPPPKVVAKAETPNPTAPTSVKPEVQKLAPSVAQITAKPEMQKPASTAAVPEAQIAQSAPVATAPPRSLMSVPKPPAAAETTPKPAAETTPNPAAETTKPAATGGAYVLQIGAYKSQTEADAAWKAYASKHSIVASYSENVRKADLGDKGIWYRLRIGSFASKDAANTFCDKLKADGASCFLAK